jgi:hypothetical protein
MPEAREPGADGDQQTDGRREVHAIVPYLCMIALAGLIGLFLLAYLWLLRDEIIAVLRQSTG